MNTLIKGGKKYLIRFSYPFAGLDFVEDVSL